VKKLQIWEEKIGENWNNSKCKDNLIYKDLLTIFIRFFLEIIEKYFLEITRNNNIFNRWRCHALITQDLRYNNVIYRLIEV